MKHVKRVKGERFVYWQHEDMYLGYMEEFPDYWTQGKSLKELKENLNDLRKDLAGGAIPEVRRVAELRVS